MRSHDNQLQVNQHGHGGARLQIPVWEANQIRLGLKFALGLCTVCLCRPPKGAKPDEWDGRSVHPGVGVIVPPEENTFANPCPRLRLRKAFVITCRFIWRPSDGG